MNGNKGIYELVYFVKDSKSLERFKNQAKSFDSYTMSKKDAEIEQLVRQASLISNIGLVLENTQEQCAYLWSRCEWEHVRRGGTLEFGGN